MIYDTYVDNLEQLPEYGEMDLMVRVLTPENRKYKYEAKYVKALISKDPSKLPDGDELQIRFQRGRLSDKKFVIKILEELGEYKEILDTKIRT